MIMFDRTMQYYSNLRSLYAKSRSLVKLMDWVWLDSDLIVVLYQLSVISHLYNGNP